jgi:hypothetical protein
MYAAFWDKLTLGIMERSIFVNEGGAVDGAGLTAFHVFSRGTFDKCAF